MFACHHCANDFRTKQGLSRHITEMHDGNKTAIGRRVPGERMFTPAQETFCQIFASDKEAFGNGVESYIKAFSVNVGKGKGKISRDQCRYYAWKMLQQPAILRRINEIFEGRGLNDAFVDKQLEKLITQDAEFRPKLGAIQEYNKLNRRTADTVNHLHTLTDIKNMSDEEIKKEKEKLQKFFSKQ